MRSLILALFVFPYLPDVSPPLLFPLFLLRNWVTLNSGCCCEYRTYRGLSDLGLDRSSGSVFVTPFLSQESGAVDERAVGRCSAASLVIPSVRPTDTFLAHCNLLFAALAAADLSAEESVERERDGAKGAVFPHVFSALGISHFDDFLVLLRTAVIFAISSVRPLRFWFLSFFTVLEKGHHFLPTVGF